MIFDLGAVAEMFSRAIDNAVSHHHFQINADNSVVDYPNYHQFKVAHFSVHLAEILGLDEAAKRDIYLLGMLHDVGFISTEIIPYLQSDDYILRHESMIEHCIIGENFVKDINFNTDINNVIMFHHEHYDGKGFFGLEKDEIPLFSRIIAIADKIDLHFDLNEISNKKEDIILYLNNHSGIYFDPELVVNAIKLFDILPDVDYSIRCDKLSNCELDYTWHSVKSVTETFMKIIDHKSHFTYDHSSSISKLLKELAIIYGYSDEMQKKLHITANLHDIGKIFISKSILEKPLPLKVHEFEIVKKHTLDGEIMLKRLKNFDDIARWVGQHHEKLNGSGYPRGLKATEIDFESQMLTVADIYTALRESRPYRKSLSLPATKAIMKDMVNRGEINGDITSKLFDLINESKQD